MYTIKLMNEYLHGPIWIYDEEGFIRKKYAIIDDDVKLKELNEKARLLYDSFYTFNEEDDTCTFDEKGYKNSFSDMKQIIEQILKRLEIINNGNFIIENYIY